MRKLMLTLLLLMLPVLAFAERPQEGNFSFKYQDLDNFGQTGTLGAEWLLPVGAHMQFGPAVSYSVLRPDAAANLDNGGLGGTALWNFSKSANGIFAGVRAIYLIGDVDGYTLAPLVGIKMGNEGFFVQFAISHPFHYDEDVVDLEQTDVTGAVGARW